MEDQWPPTVEQLARALATLSPDDRRILGLAARDRLPNDAIARRLGLSLQEATRRLARALRRLDRAIERQ